MGSQLSPGLLVAAPALLDPSFRRSVVLLVEHKAEGALGFVVNRPSPFNLSGIASQLGMETIEGDLAESSVLVGGPVAPHTGWILYDHAGYDEKSDEMVEVTSRLAVSASRDLLRRVLTGQGPSKQVLVLGYAGWGPGQLDHELSQGAWIPSELDERILFETPYGERWGGSLKALGIDPARIVASPPFEA
ncbi:MAG: YqgE/AlgH family protein [Proteobacteria bacterium]|nr:YqgE/AlgH family protein [Pseudomonadota bacterium]